MTYNQIQQLKSELAQAQALLENSYAIKGAWYCQKCDFVLQKNNLYMQSGTIGPDTSPFNEICPNDGTLMQPLTFQKAYLNLVKCCEQQVERAVKAETDLAQARATIAELEKDKERLDFIEGHNVRITKPSDVPPWSVVISANGGFIREAIDAAIAANKHA